MITSLKIEWLKERRTANKRTLYIIPIIFIIVIGMFTLLMSGSEPHRNYAIAITYNWYPLLILPLIMSVLVSNTIRKENNKDNHPLFLNLSEINIFLSKLIIIALELLILVFINMLVLAISLLVISDNTVTISDLFKASVCLYIGQLATLPLTFILVRCLNIFLTIFINFIMSLLGALLAVTIGWIYYPWSYSLRMMAAVLRVHPNGTFIESSSQLIDSSNIGMGLGAVLTVFSITLLLGVLVFHKVGVKR